MSIEDLARQLEDPNEEVRHLAVQNLAAHGGEALALLGRALGDGSWRVRKAALEAFLAVPGEEKVEILLRGIRDEESAGRRNTSMEALIRLGERALPHLPSILGDGDPDVRKFGVDILGNIDDVRALNLLLESLQDPEDNVSAAAAEYLGRKRCREAVPALVSRLKKGDFWVKYSCLKALGEIGDPAAGQAVLEAAGERDLRKAAFEALGKMNVPEAAPLVAEGLFSRDKGLRQTSVLSAARLLRSAGKGDEKGGLRETIRRDSTAELVDYLRELLYRDDPELRAASMAVLGVAAGKDAIGSMLEILAGAPEEEQALVAGVLEELPEEDLPALYPSLRDPQPAVRRWVARILGMRRSAAAVPALVGLLEDENGHVRAETARALGRIGDRLAMAPLVSLLGDAYPDVRQAGVDALCGLGQAGDEMRQLVLSVLGPQLDSPNQELVANALRIFARLGSRDVLERLRFSLKDERSQIRKAAVEALGSIEGPESAEVLRIALTDEDAAVRREAVHKIGDKTEAATLPFLLPMLQDEDLWVRVRAVQAIALQEGKEAQECLLETVRRETPGPVRLAAIKGLGRVAAGRELLLGLASSGDRESRMAAIEALGRSGGRETVDCLLACLEDEDWGLRSAALRSLTRFAGEAGVRDALDRAARTDNDPMVRKAAADLLEKAAG